MKRYTGSVLAIFALLAVSQPVLGGEVFVPEGPFSFNCTLQTTVGYGGKTTQHVVNKTVTDADFRSDLGVIISSEIKDQPGFGGHTLQITYFKYKYKNGTEEKRLSMNVMIFGAAENVGTVSSSSQVPATEKFIKQTAAISFATKRQRDEMNALFAGRKSKAPKNYAPEMEYIEVYGACRLNPQDAQLPQSPQGTDQQKQ